MADPICRVLMRCYTSDSYDGETGGCDAAELVVTPELARKLADRIVLLQALRASDPGLREMRYWDVPVSFFTTGYDDDLDAVLTEKGPLVYIDPTEEPVPEDNYAKTSFDACVVRPNDVYFYARPKWHDGIVIDTQSIPHEMILGWLQKLAVASAA